MNGTALLPEKNRIWSEKIQESWCLLRKEVEKGATLQSDEEVCDKEMEVIRRDEVGRCLGMKEEAQVALVFPGLEKTCCLDIGVVYLLKGYLGLRKIHIALIFSLPPHIYA